MMARISRLSLAVAWVVRKAGPPELKPCLRPNAGSSREKRHKLGGRRLLRSRPLNCRCSLPLYELRQ